MYWSSPEASRMKASSFLIEISCPVFVHAIVAFVVLPIRRVSPSVSRQNSLVQTLQSGPNNLLAAHKQALLIPADFEHSMFTS